MSEEELSVAVHRCHDVRRSDDLADVYEVETEVIRTLVAPDIEQRVVERDTTGCQLVQIGALPLIWDVAGIVWSELTSEGPDWVFFFVSELVVIGETFDRHIANVLTDLRKLGMRRHQIAFVLWEGNVSVVNRLEEIECIWVAFKRMEGKVVSCIDAISKVFESSRGGRNKVWANSADF